MENFRESLSLGPTGWVGSLAAAELGQQWHSKKVGTCFKLYCSCCLSVLLPWSLHHPWWAATHIHTHTEKSCNFFLPQMDSSAPAQCMSWGHTPVLTWSHLCADFSFFNTGRGTVEMQLVWQELPRGIINLHLQHCFCSTFSYVPSVHSAFAAECTLGTAGCNMASSESRRAIAKPYCQHTSV